MPQTCSLLLLEFGTVTTMSRARDLKAVYFFVIPTWTTVRSSVFDMRDDRDNLTVCPFVPVPLPFPLLSHPCLSFAVLGIEHSTRHLPIGRRSTTEIHSQPYFYVSF